MTPHKIIAALLGVMGLFCAVPLAAQPRSVLLDPDPPSAVTGADGRPLQRFDRSRVPVSAFDDSAIACEDLIEAFRSGKEHRSDHFALIIPTERDNVERFMLPKDRVTTLAIEQTFSADSRRESRMEYSGMFKLFTLREYEIL